MALERVGDRELLELLLDARLAPHAGGVVQRKLRPLPVEIDRDRVARDAGLRPGEQALLAEQTVDQRRLAGIRPADHRDADRAVAARSLVGLLIVVRLDAAVCSGNAARSAS